MKLLLTNTSEIPVPIMSRDEGGWAETLEPGEPTLIEKLESDVWLIGDKPDMLDAIRDLAGALFTAVSKMLSFWRDRQHDLDADERGLVSVTIDNQGPNAVRVVLGDPTNETHVNPGEIIDGSAKDYIEIREMGSLK
jgi:hypothetical protein